MTDRRPGFSQVPTDQWAVPYTNPRGRVRWQPVLPDGRRKYRTLLDNGWRPEHRATIFPPKLYASRWWAERVAMSKWRKEFRESKKEFTET